MTQTFTCGDHSALVSYLYDECEPNERRAISAHAALCGACAEEIASLGATRELLSAWSPPEAQLGFRVVSDAPQPNVSHVLRPQRWWQRPMPAWAQAAAAAAIFATGLTLGALRGATATTGAPAANSQGSNVTLAATPAAAVTPGELSALERRLRTEMSQMRNTSGAATASAGDAQIVERVRAMIQESEQRQQRELALRTAEIVRDFDAQRQGDLTRIERAMGQMDGTTGVEVAQQRQMLNYLMRVSQRGQ